MSWIFTIYLYCLLCHCDLEIHAFQYLQEVIQSLAVVAYTFNPNTWDVEVGKSLEFQTSLVCLHKETLAWKTKTKQQNQKKLIPKCIKFPWCSFFDDFIRDVEILKNSTNQISQTEKISKGDL